jgi:hypothetical protein
MKSSTEQAENFWSWFTANNNKYLFLDVVDDEEKESLMDALLSQLHKFCNQLYFLIGGGKEQLVFELILTAEGNSDYFSHVEFLVAKAPPLKDWQVIAFKQPVDEPFFTMYQGRRFDPAETIFIVLQNKNRPESLGIRVFFSDYNEDERDDFLTGTYIMLDSLIGEKAAMLDIDYLDVAITPVEINKYNFMQLSQLRSFMQTRK